MSSMLSSPLLQTYTLSAAALIINLYGLGFLTAKTRADRKVVVNSEDAGLNRNASVAEVEHLDVLRIKRAHLNALENAIPFFAIAFLFTMTNPGVTLTRALFGAFVLLRYVHSFAYVKALQPIRTLAFVGGALINLGLLVLVVIAAL